MTVSPKNIRRTIGMTIYDAMASLTGRNRPRPRPPLTEYTSRFSDKYMTAKHPLSADPADAPPRPEAVRRSTKTRNVSVKRKYQMESLIDLVVGMEYVAQAKPAPGRNPTPSAAISGWKRRPLYW